MAKLPRGYQLNGWNDIDGHIYANISLTKWAVFKLKIKAYLNVLRSVKLEWHG